jgi:endonuclease/exonuclease/phosphatase family metal-dependent hydrolase
VWLGDQLQAITGCVYTERCLQDGAPMLPELPYYVMAGDFNTRSSEHIAVMRKVLSWAGLEPVPGIGKTQKYLTAGMGRLDHIFASGGLAVEDSGVVPGFFGTGSDHRPVWAVLRLSGQKREPWSGFDSESPWDASTSPTAVECTCATVDCS